MRRFVIGSLMLALVGAALAGAPAGAVLVTPAGVAHFVWARGGEVLYQEAGVGPTGTAFVGR